MTKPVWHLIVYFYLHNFYYFNMCIVAKKILYAVLLKRMLIHSGSFSMYWGVLLAAEALADPGGGAPGAPPLTAADL